MRTCYRNPGDPACTCEDPERDGPTLEGAMRRLRAAYEEARPVQPEPAYDPEEVF